MLFSATLRAIAILIGLATLGSNGHAQSPVGITPLPKDIRGNRNDRLGTVKRVIQVLMTARFDHPSWPTRVAMRA